MPEERTEDNPTPPRPTEKELFLAARELDDPAERAAWLREACGGDSSLLARVLDLLEAGEEDEDSFLEPDRERLGEAVSAVGRELRDEQADPGVAGGTVDVQHGDRTVVGMLEAGFHEKPGDTIGRYKLLQKIGEGGGGVVYMADQTEPVKRRVALKVIKLGMDTRQVVARFEAERQALALMDHPNIAKVLDAGATESGRPYFVMELVRGVPITTFCDENKLSTSERLELFIQVCEAVQHAHQKGIIHRDLKPGNVLVTMMEDRPVPKVIDFGVAKATQQELTEKTLFTQHGHFLGTPAYMSPEQASLTGYDIDTRSDIYALGVLLYELLTGGTPFDSTQLLEAGYDEIRRVIAEDDPPKPSTRLSTMDDGELTALAGHRQSRPHRLSRLVRGELDWIVMKALEKDRRRRYETANGFAMDVQRHLANEPVTAGRPSLAYKAAKFTRRNKTALGVAAAIALILLAATTVSTWQAVRAFNAEKASAANAAAEKAAREEAEEISNFIISVLQSPDPERDGHKVTVVETLDAAARELEARFADQPERRARLQWTLGETYSGLGLYDRALAIRETIWTTYREPLGPDHPKTIAAMGNLASSYADVGRHDEALAMREKLVAHHRKLSGPEHPDTLSAMHNLALSYDDVGRWEEALAMKEDVLRVRRRVCGPEHPDTLLVMQNLAASYHDAGRRQEALEMTEEVLKLRREVPGSEHSDMLVVMQNLAVFYGDLGRREEALEMNEKVLALKSKVFGEEHPDTVRLMHNLGLSYLRTGRNADAQQLLEKVATLGTKSSGPENEITLAAMSALAVLYSDGGHRDEALKLNTQVLERYRRCRGNKHPDTLGAMNNLARSFFEAGRHHEALELQKEVVSVSRELLGPRHPQTLGSLSNLSVFHGYAGNNEEELKLSRQVLELSREIHGPVHPGTLRAMSNLAILHRKAGRAEQSLKLWEEAVAVCRKELGETHPTTLGEMQSVAGLLLHIGRRKEGVEMQEKILALFERDHEPEHPGRLLAMHIMAETYHDVGRGKDSLDMYAKTLPLTKRIRGEKHRLTLGAMTDLAIRFEGAGRVEEALKLQEEALRIKREVLPKDDRFLRVAMHNMADIYAKLDRGDEALEVAEELLALCREVLGPDHPETGSAHTRLGHLYDRPGRINNAEKAIAAWQEAVRINPKNANIQYYLARKLIFSNRIEEAVAPLQAARQLYPKGDRGREVRTRLTKALSDLGREKEAAEVRQELDRQFPDG